MADPTGCPPYIIVAEAGNTAYNGIYEKVSDIKYVLQSDNTKQLFYNQAPPSLPFLPDFWKFSPNPYTGNEAYSYQVPDKNNPPCPQSLPASDDPNWSIGVQGTLPLPSIAVYSIPTLDPIAERNAKYSTATEPGSARFRRLLALGYV